MSTKLQVYNRLPLQGAFNVRELGGLPAENDAITKYCSFLRSDGLTHLTNKDIHFLKDFGLKTVIDLRSPDELTTMPNPFAKDKETAYHNIAFAPGEISDATKAERVTSDDFMADFYLFLLSEAKDRVKTIFETIADAQDGVVLFHCTAGKDRTGVLAMLLLGLVGVADYDIAANYQISYTYLRQTKFYKELEETAIPQMLQSKEEWILKSVDYIKKNYGSVLNYLVSCEVDNDAIALVRNRLI